MTDHANDDTSDMHEQQSGDHSLPAPYAGNNPHNLERPGVFKALVSPLIFGALLLLKFGKFALIALKGVKFASTSVSMLVSIAAYAWIFGLDGQAA